MKGQLETGAKFVGVRDWEDLEDFRTGRRATTMGLNVLVHWERRRERDVIWCALVWAGGPAGQSQCRIARLINRRGREVFSLG